jgi:hypothetical protein
MNGGRSGGLKWPVDLLQKYGETMRNEVIGIAKLRGGPGGWKCPCCNPMNCSPRNMKHLARRMVRHITKQRMAKDIQEDL